MKKLSNLIIFAAVLSQVIFLTKNNVTYANCISYLVFLPFAVIVFNTKNIYFNRLILILSFLSGYWATTLIFKPHSEMIPLANLRTIIIVPFFLFMIYNIICKYDCSSSLRWAFIFSIFVNFYIYTMVVNSSFWGAIYSGGRFQGSFENPNMAASVFFLGMMFSFYDIDCPNRPLRYMAWAGILLSPVLIVSTASRQGMILMLFAFLLFPLFYLKYLGKKRLTGFLLIVLVFFLVIFNSKYNLGLNKSFKLINYRFQKLERSIEYPNYISGSTSIRRVSIESGLKGFLDAPIFGHGFNAFTNCFNGRSSDNNYVELLFNGGLIIFLAYYYLYFYCFKLGLLIQENRLKVFILSIVLALLIGDMADVTYASKFVMYVFLIIITMAEKELRSKRKFGEIKLK